MPPVSGPTTPVDTPPVTPDAQPAPQASPAPAGVTHDGRQVSAGEAQSPVAPALARGEQAPAAGPTRTAAAADGEFVNQPGELRQPNLQRASLLRRLAHNIRDAVGRLGNRLRAAFGFGPRTLDPESRGKRPAGAQQPAPEKRVSDPEREGGPTMEQELNRRLDEANREPGAEEFEGWTEAQLLEREAARNRVFAEERGIPADSAESATPAAEATPDAEPSGERKPVTGRETAV